MAEEIIVSAVVVEKTHVGKVQFPVTVPERLVDLLQFPDDVFQLAEKMGLDSKAVKFLMAILRGKWGLRPVIDLQDIAIKTGMQYDDMDEIVRSLIDKNYAKLNDRLDLYRFWIVLLHIKGIRFVPGRD